LRDFAEALDEAWSVMHQAKPGKAALQSESKVDKECLYGASGAHQSYVAKSVSRLTERFCVLSCREGLRKILLRKPIRTRRPSWARHFV